MESIEVGWPAIIDIFGTTPTPYIHVNITVYKICWLDLGTFNLHVFFYYTGNFVHTQKMLSNQGRKAVFSLCSKINEDLFNCETLLSLFDTYVSSILNYGCEVW